MLKNTDPPVQPYSLEIFPFSSQHSLFSNCFPLWITLHSPLQDSHLNFQIGNFCLLLFKENLVVTGAYVEFLCSLFLFSIKQTNLVSIIIQYDLIILWLCFKQALILHLAKSERFQSYRTIALLISPSVSVLHLFTEQGEK